MIHTTQEYQIGDNVELMRELSPGSIDTIVTSPPYWGLRDYGVDGQIGLEPMLEEYHARMLDVTAECMRVLKPAGVMFWNHGDSYFGDSPIRKSAADQFNPDEQHVLKRSAGGIRRSAKSQGGLRPKCMTMQNERLIIRMIDDQGWILRNRIIWNKPNGMPSSVTDRFSNKYEPVYMLVKSKKYWFDLDAVRVPQSESSRKRAEYGEGKPKKVDTTGMSYGQSERGFNNYLSENGMRLNPLGKNPGDVWTIPTQPYPESHFATFPTALIEPMIKAACPAEICPVCGIARGRIVEIEKMDDEDDSTRKKRPRIGGTMREVPEKGWKSIHHTAGWTSCDCDAGWIAGTVLDPFCGSGTVLEVCRLLHRNAIGLELNPEYEPLIKARSMSHTPPLTAY